MSRAAVSQPTTKAAPGKRAALSTKRGALVTTISARLGGLAGPAELAAGAPAEATALASLTAAGDGCPIPNPITACTCANCATRRLTSAAASGGLSTLAADSSNTMRGSGGSTDDEMEEGDGADDDDDDADDEDDESAAWARRRAHSRCSARWPAAAMRTCPSCSGLKEPGTSSTVGSGGCAAARAEPSPRCDARAYTASEADGSASGGLTRHGGRGAAAAPPAAAAASDATGLSVCSSEYSTCVTGGSHDASASGSGTVGLAVAGDETAAAAGPLVAEPAAGARAADAAARSRSKGSGSGTRQCSTVSTGRVSAARGSTAAAPALALSPGAHAWPPSACAEMPPPASRSGAIAAAHASNTEGGASCASVAALTRTRPHKSSSTARLRPAVLSSRNANRWTELDVTAAPKDSDSPRLTASVEIALVTAPPAGVSPAEHSAAALA